MRLWLAIAALAWGLVAVPAQACMASGPDGFTHGLIWDNPQSDIPDDAMLLKVRATEPISGLWLGFQAVVIEGPQEMSGEVINVIAEAGHSCVGFGQQEGWLVVRRTADEQRSSEGTLMRVYSAIEYEPSIWNEALRYLGGEPWQYPGTQGPGRRQFP